MPKCTQNLKETVGWIVGCSEGLLDEDLLGVDSFDEHLDVSHAAVHE